MRETESQSKGQIIRRSTKFSAEPEPLKQELRPCRGERRSLKGGNRKKQPFKHKDAKTEKVHIAGELQMPRGRYRFHT